MEDLSDVYEVIILLTSEEVLVPLEDLDSSLPGLHNLPLSLVLFAPAEEAVPELPDGGLVLFQFFQALQGVEVAGIRGA